MIEEKFKVKDEVIVTAGFHAGDNGIIIGKSQVAIRRQELGTWLVRFGNGDVNEYDEFAGELERRKK